MVPLPNNAFQPAPIPLPGRNESCFCGSGRKFKRCCRPELEQADALLMPDAGIWMMVVQALTPKMLRQITQHPDLPLTGRIAMAEAARLEEDFEQVIRVLAPYFRLDPFPEQGQEAEFALDTLCDAYIELQLHERKLELLREVVDRAHASPLRSGAWQRLASIHADLGDLDQAWLALKAARRDAPSSLGVNVLEVQLLLLEEQFEQARARARFVLKQVARDLDEEGEMVRDMMKRVVDDPVQARMTLMDLSDLPVEERLWAQIRDAFARPLKAVQVRLCPGEVSTTARAGKIRVWEVDPSAELVDLERAWRNLDSAPFAEEDDEESGLPFFFYLDDEAAQWSEFLQHHPQALDSLEILNDLYLFFLGFRNAFAAETTEVLLDRMMALASPAMDRLPEGAIMPWGIPANRPLLLALYYQGLRLEAFQQPGQAKAVWDWLLCLDPLDSQGVRSKVINTCLVTGQDEEALALCERFPDNDLVEMAYGRTLLLFRLGRRDEAAKSALTAKAHWPKVASYLVNSAQKEPQLAYWESGMDGGREDAWLYRQAMRSTWKASRGALTWLKKV